jgi:hypothetical protein
MTSTRPSTPGPSAAPIVLDPPPAYLQYVPDYVLRPADRPRDQTHGADRLARWLRWAGVRALPTLAEVEAERARRGMRRVDVRDGSGR